MSRHTKERITKAVSIDSKLARWAERQAANENRSLSNFVETLLLKIKSDEEAGLEPPTQQAA